VALQRNERGESVAVIVTGNDISERKRTEEALRVSEERYALAMAASDDGLWDVDFIARSVFLSARARELAGLLPGAEIVPLDEFVALLPLHPNDVARRQAAMQAHLAGNAPAYVGEFRLRQLDGVYCWRRISGICVRDANGAPLPWAGSISDIDARKRAEDALRVSEERYALAMEAAADGHMDWNFLTGDFYISPRMLQIVGHPPDATFADHADWVARFPFHPEDRKRWETAIAAHFAGREAIFKMDLRIVVNGEMRWLAFNFIATREPAAKVVRWTGSITDLTDAKRDVATVIEYIPGLVAILTPAGEVDAVNDQLAEYCGQPLEAMKQWGTNGTVHAEDCRTSQSSSCARYRRASPTTSRRGSGDSTACTAGTWSAGTRPATRRARSCVGTSCFPTSTIANAPRRRCARVRNATSGVMLAAEAGFWEWDVPADKVYISPKLLEMTGFPPGTEFASRSDFSARAPFLSR
jgi:PAS domain S-box-containing protein